MKTTLQPIIQQLLCLCIVILIHPTYCENWIILSGISEFTPRHSQATCIFRCPDGSDDKCIWLTGGYSDLHRAFNLEMENENSDIWWSKDGASWNQITNIYGDYLQGIGNEDAKIGGSTAPWYSRYGHSLNALDGDGDGIADVMILAGGFSPVASNDVWITADGISWYFEGYAPWTPRAYHGAAVFLDKLWVLGGSPLTKSDVWLGELEKDVSRKSGFRLEWREMAAGAWTKRAGFCVVIRKWENVEYMFLLGGLAVSEDDNHPLTGGTRARNDIWRTINGVSWDKVVPSSNTTSSWGPRAFHACATIDTSTGPLIVITGGGYMGRRGNNYVRALEAYTDTWISKDIDGAYWTRINYEEGSKSDDNLYSTNEWTETSIKGRKVCRGKWGHSMVTHTVPEQTPAEVKTMVDDSLDSVLDSPVTDQQGTNVGLETIPVVEDETRDPLMTMPSVFVIGGKVESEPAVNDVFKSSDGILSSWASMYI